MRNLKRHYKLVGEVLRVEAKAVTPRLKLNLKKCRICWKETDRKWKIWRKVGSKD